MRTRGPRAVGGKRHLRRMRSSAYGRHRLRRPLPVRRVMPWDTAGVALPPSRGSGAVVPPLLQRSGRAGPHWARGSGTAMRCPHQTWPPPFAPRKDGCRAAPYVLRMHLGLACVIIMRRQRRQRQGKGARGGGGRGPGLGPDGPLLVLLGPSWSFSARVSCSGCRAASSAGNPAGLRNAVWPCPGSQGPCRGRAPQGGTRGINRSPRLPAFGARRPVPQPALTYSALRARGPRPRARGAVTPAVDARARERGLTWFGTGAGGTRPAVVPGFPLRV